jgi:hypothetical protein
MSAKEILEKARKARKETEKAKTEAKINEARAKMSLAKNKLQSTDFDLKKSRDERDAVEFNVAEIATNKEFLSEEDYRLAINELSEKLHGLTKRIEELVNQRKRLEMEINCVEASLSILNDKMTGNRVFQIDDSERKKISEAVMVEACRKDIQDIYQQINGIPAEVKYDPSYVQLHCAILAGKLRAVQQKVAAELTGCEQVILRRTFGRIGTITKGTWCGKIEALDSSYDTDWDSYVARHEEALKTKTERPASERKMKEDEYQDSEEELKLMEMIVSSGLTEQTKGKRMAILGGEPSKEANEKRRLWLENALGLKSLVWHEQEKVNNLCTSLKNQGLDMLLIFTKWIGHSTYYTAVDEAKSVGIPVILCPSPSRRAICMELTSLFQPQITN